MSALFRLLFCLILIQLCIGTEPDPQKKEKKAEVPFKKKQRPDDWKSLGDDVGGGDPNFLYTWICTNDPHPRLEDYDDYFECKACKIDFLKQDFEKEYCEKFKDEKDIVKKIIGLGRLIRKEFKKAKYNKCKQCYEHAGALNETLTRCGIDGTLTSHYWAAGKAGHSWMKIEVKIDGKDYVIYADAYNDHYLKVPKEKAKRRLIEGDESYEDWYWLGKVTQPPDGESCVLCDYIYYNDGIERTWAESRELCRNEFNSDLASITTAGQMDCASYAIGDGPPPFIGLFSASRNSEHSHIKPYYYHYVDGTSCPQECKGIYYSGACLGSCFWGNGEPLPCYEGYQCVRFVPESRTINNDIPCDQKLQAVLCNGKNSVSMEQSICNNKCDNGFGQSTCSESEGTAFCECDKDGYPVVGCGVRNAASMISAHADADYKVPLVNNASNLYVVMLFSAIVSLFLVGNILVCVWCANKQTNHTIKQ